MKKIIAIICLALMLLASVSGCSAQLDSWSQILGDETDYKSGYLIESSKGAINTPKEELASINAADFLIKNEMMLGRFKNEFYASSGFISLGDLHKNFPVEHIIVLDESHVCAVYKQDLKAHTFIDEERCAYIYVVLERSELESGREQWYNTVEYYYVGEKLLSSKDFANVKIGDSAEKVSAIDHSVLYDRVPDNVGGAFTDKFTSYRLLTDGIMVIKFDGETGEHSFDLSGFTVSNVSFYPYGSTDAPEELTLINFPDIIK